MMWCDGTGEMDMEHKECVAELLKVYSIDDWNKLAKRVKAENGGQYPEWWYPKIIASGLADGILREFGASTEIKCGYE